jgi:hypothetical protein
MEKHNLKDFTKGWFLGNFNPTLLKTHDFEVAVKRYNKGDYEDEHFHEIATEWTVMIEGSAKMNDVILHKDDIVIVYPGDAVKFEALEDCSTVVIKSPSIKNDKYLK